MYQYYNYYYYWIWCLYLKKFKKFNLIGEASKWIKQKNFSIIIFVPSFLPNYHIIVFDI